MNQERIIRIRRISQVALLSALALVLSYLETMIPLPVAVPGIKLGLANVAVLVALYLCDVRSASLVMLIKVLASGFLFGSPLMLAYSAGGTLLAFAGMLICRALPWIDVVPTSMIAAILHNVGQLAVTAVFLSTTAVFLTLPVLAFAACVTGLLTGLVAQGVIAAVPAPSLRPYHFEQDELFTQAGKITAVVGRNGSGKTTLALNLAGLLPKEFDDDECASAGERRLNGCDTTRKCDTATSESLSEQDHSAFTYDGLTFTGIAFQNPDNQIVASTVEDDCAFGLENRGLSYDEMHRVVKDSLNKQGIHALAKRKVNELSGGEKQKLATAGLVALSPSTLVFDESAAMLNPAARADFWNQCRALAEEGKAVVAITHSMEDAFACDYLVIVNEGHISWQGKPDELSKSGAVSSHTATSDAAPGDAGPSDAFPSDAAPSNAAHGFNKLEESLTNAGLELPLVLKVSQEINSAGIAFPYCSSEEEFVDELSFLLAKPSMAAGQGDTTDGKQNSSSNRPSSPAIKPSMTTITPCVKEARS